MPENVLSSNGGRLVVALLGPPRSGSSAIMRGLTFLGVYLGADIDLRKADGGNPEGFWEDNRVLAVCEGFMGDLGMRWDSLRPLGPNDFQTDLAARYTRRASQIVADAVRAAPGPWGLKNPRMARMVPIWMDAFATTGCDDRYVISLRNPLSVAASVIRGSPYYGAGCWPTYLHLVWLLHMVGALSPVLKGKSGVIVDYDAVMANPAAEMQRLASAIGLACGDERALEEYGQTFLKSGLRHADFSAEDILTDPLVPSVVGRAHAILSASAAGALPLNSPEFSSRWKSVLAEFDELRPVLLLLDSQHSALAARRGLVGAIYRRLPMRCKRALSRS